MINENMQTKNIVVVTTTIIISLAIIIGLSLINPFATEYSMEMFLSALCYITSVTILLLSARCKGRLVMSIPLSFAFLYVIFIYIGGIGHFLYSGEIVTLIPYVFQDYNYDLLIVVNIGILLVAFGTLAANYFTKFKPQEEINNYFEQKVINDLPGFETNPVFIGSLLICITCGLISAFSLPQIPIIYSLTHPGDLRGIMDLRNDFSSIKGIGTLQFFYIRIFSLLMFLILGISMISKSKYVKVLAIIITPIFLFFIAMSSHRTYLLEYTFVIFIFLNYMGLKINVKNLLYLGTVIFILFAGITIRNMDIDFSDIAGIMFFGRIIFLRFFIDQMVPLAFITENFPQQHNFLWGYTYLQDLSVFLPGVQETFSMWVSKELNPEIEDIGSAPTCVSGEFYANFYYPGLIIGMFLLGYIMQWIFIYFIRKKRTVSNITLLTLINYPFCSLTIAGLYFGFFLRLLPVLIALLVIKKMFALINPDTEVKE